MIENRRHFRRLYSVLGVERGFSSENLVYRIITERVEAEQAPDWLSSYQKSTTEDDRRGIDAWFHTDVGKIPIQIKSSKRGRDEALRKKPCIPIVVIQIGMDNDTIFQRCIQIVEQERNKYLKLRE